MLFSVLAQAADSNLIGPIVGGLINAGGMGLFAAALFLLHRESLKAFRDELKESRTSFNVNLAAERQQCSEQFERTLEDAKDKHAEVMTAIGHISRELGIHIATTSNRGPKNG